MLLQEYRVWTLLGAQSYWAVIFFFKLATNAYHDDQQLVLLGDRILRCLCGLPLFDLNPRSSALKINVLTIGPPRITIIIKSKVNIVFKKMNNE